MSEYKLTVFTPTYNRAYSLPRLYNSLLGQCHSRDFEWLIIDDASTDETPELVKKWIDTGNIDINYIRLEKNGGKPRAINEAVKKAKSQFLFIVDSDDYLADGTISFILDKTGPILHKNDILGIGMLQGSTDGTPFKKPKFTDYVDATNLQRNEYGIDIDCNEVYKASILKNYTFEVWPGENFTPEETVLNAMALDGYKIRWYARVGVISEYQSDGLTKGSWNLQKRNPMGYAILYNSKLRYQRGFLLRFKSAAQMVAQVLLGGSLSYLKRSNDHFITTIAFPYGFAIYLRRLWQYRSR